VNDLGVLFRAPPCRAMGAETVQIHAAGLSRSVVTDTDAAWGPADLAERGGAGVTLT
ncbi:MAG: hypothetical protein QOI83_3823, partial [Streptomycetaceae bacterium]|nr:hypothetical protein [Streptomycetaceae bacterium]